MTRIIVNELPSYEFNCPFCYSVIRDRELGTTLYYCKLQDNELGDWAGECNIDKCKYLLPINKLFAENALGHHISDNDIYYAEQYDIKSR